jgi:hypothetical protein
MTWRTSVSGVHGVAAARGAEHDVVVSSAGFNGLLGVERGEVLIDSGLTYDGITPVRVRVTKREGRYEVSDDGGAVAAAGVDRGWLAFGERIGVGEYCANVSRQGVVFLPGGFDRRGEEWISKLPGIVAEASCILYEALLELDE